MKEFVLGNDTFYVKFRPGLREFLNTVMRLYDVHVYTMVCFINLLLVCKLCDARRACVRTLWRW